MILRVDWEVLAAQERLKMKNYLFASWSDIENICVEMHARMLEDGYQPDVIIGIMKGGMIPASLLIDLFKNPIKFIAIEAKSYDDISVRLGYGKKVKIYPEDVFSHIKNCYSCIDLPFGKNILLVDDIWDTGQTANAILDKLKEHFIVRTATAFVRERKYDSVVDCPDYYGKVVKDEWVVFPWEKYEFHRLVNNKQ